MTRQLLEDIRSKLIEYSGKPKSSLSDKEIGEIQKVMSKAIGKKVDTGMGDISMHTSAMDFGGNGKYDIFVGSKNGKPPYGVEVIDVDSGNPVESKSAKDFKSVLSIVTQLAKKHKKGLTSS